MGYTIHQAVNGFSASFERWHFKIWTEKLWAISFHL